MTDPTRTDKYISPPDSRVNHRSTKQGTVLSQRGRAIEVRLQTELLHPNDSHLLGEWMIQADDVAEGKDD